MKEIKNKVAWGITGSGDKLKETVDVMTGLRKVLDNKVEIDVYVSKAGDQVLRYYRLVDSLKKSFPRVWIEVDANTPFIVGRIQSGEYRFLLVAPTTSNTVAKVAHGISDTLLTNAVLQSLKANVPVYVMPTDFTEGETTTTLPNGRQMKLRVRVEDADNVRAISKMEGVVTFEKPEGIPKIFEKELGLNI